METSRATHLVYDSSEYSYRLHISHIFSYVSAYEYCEQTHNDLVDRIENALVKAKETTEVQVVDQDGECCLHVNPSGSIVLMLPWRQYRLYKEDEE